MGTNQKENLIVSFLGFQDFLFEMYITESGIEISDLEALPFNPSPWGFQISDFTLKGLSVFSKKFNSMKFRRVLTI